MYKKYLLLILLIQCLLVASTFAQTKDSPVNTYSKVVDSFKKSWREEELPEEFSSLREGLSAGCILANLKNQGLTNLILRRNLLQRVSFVIYDKVGKTFKKSNEICIPTWYGEADARLVQLFNSKQQFLLIEHFGNTGTGTAQRLHLILGWHKDYFKPILWETVNYEVDSVGSLWTLNLTYNIKRGKNPEISMKYNYKAKGRDKLPFDFSSSWADKLTWNEKTRTFYDEKLEKEKMEANDFYSVCQLLSPISATRIKIVNLNIKELCEDQVSRILIDTFFEKAICAENK